jgi:hypothetical protein
MKVDAQMNAAIPAVNMAANKTTSSQAKNMGLLADIYE